MARTVRCGLIQARNVLGPDRELAAIKKAMIDKHVTLIGEAARKKVKILCLQELFYGPYFCAEQETRWYHLTERVPDGPTVKLMRKLAKKHKMVLIVPIYEEEQTGVYYNTAAVIDADGTYLGKYRKTHIPHCKPGFWEKFYFRPGNLGYPVFETAFAKVGVYICYDRHFPEGRPRARARTGAEIVFNPSATVAGLSEYLWKLEQPAHAVANGYFVGAINRVGHEAPVEHRRVLRPELLLRPARPDHRRGPARPGRGGRGRSQPRHDRRRSGRPWQFYRDRRPDAYGPLTAL